MGIAERARNILEAFTDRQTSTAAALDQLELLMEERRTLDQERANSGLDDQTFAVFWVLKRERLPDPEKLAREIDDGLRRFPNFAVNADELRQAKAEIYKTLLREVQEQRMLVLAEELLRAVRK